MAALGSSYYFGVEIELIAQPYNSWHPLPATAHYQALASSLRHHGTNAIADRLDQAYRKRPEHYDKWWITRDGSLGQPDRSCVALEAVSPILSTDHYWQSVVDVFWMSLGQVFHMPNASRRCGSHIHVSPSPQRRFDMNQLRSIAFGIVYYEPLITKLLPYHRQYNKYCMDNTIRSERLLALTCVGPEHVMFQLLWRELLVSSNERDVRDVMQAGSVARYERRVRWNFDNVCPGRSGTIEFRGGPGLRGPVKTKRWTSFVLAFIHLCSSMNGALWSHHPRPGIESFWRHILRAAEAIRVEEHLPRDWEVMAELTSTNSYEELMGSHSDDSDWDEKASVVDKSDFEYSDSDDKYSDLDDKYSDSDDEYSDSDDKY